MEAVETPGRASCERTPNPDTEPCPGTGGQEGATPGSPASGPLTLGGRAGVGRALQPLKPQRRQQNVSAFDAAADLFQRTEG